MCVCIGVFKKQRKMKESVREKEKERTQRINTETLPKMYAININEFKVLEKVIHIIIYIYYILVLLLPLRIKIYTTVQWLEIMANDEKRSLCARNHSPTPHTQVCVS